MSCLIKKNGIVSMMTSEKIFVTMETFCGEKLEKIKI